MESSTYGQKGYSMKDFIFPVNLQLFAEGGAAAGGEGGAEGTGVSAPAAGVQTKGAKSNPYANVVFGKQPTQSADGAPAAEVQTETQTAEKPVDRHAEFEAMIKGDYKEAYDKRVQDTIQKRLKGAKETSDKYEATLPLMDLLAAKYGVDASDPAAIVKAIEADDDFFDGVASEQGMDVKSFRKMAKIESENARLKAAEAQRAKDQAWSARVADWVQQANDAKTEFPELDFNKEMENKEFQNRLFNGYSVRDAYLTTHKDELFTGLATYATKTAKQQVANSIAASGKRPAENGMQGQSSVIVKSDPSKWTKADRAEVARRVARGERIEL
jgi:hypothetical protein